MIEKITITLPKYLANIGRKYAKQNGQTLSGLIRISLMEKIKQSPR